MGKSNRRTPVSKKRRYVNIEYVDWGTMKEHLFGNKNIGNCILCGEYLGLEKHHTITRSRGGTKEDLKNVCGKCHAWVGKNPKKAAKIGLYIKGYKINE